jgi:hypothetical protein
VLEVALQLFLFRKKDALLLFEFSDFGQVVVNGCGGHFQLRLALLAGIKQSLHLILRVA